LCHGLDFIPTRVLLLIPTKIAFRSLTSSFGMTPTVTLPLVLRAVS
jgi:hypothetical protein